MTETRRESARIAFTALLLLAVLIVIGLSLSLSATARTFPLIVAIPSGLLLMLQLWRDVWPRLGDRVPFLREQSIVEIDLPKDLSDVAEMQSTRKESDGAMSEGQAILWLSGLAAAVFFVHYLLAAPLFLLAFLRLQARRSWKSTVLVSAAVWLVLYLLFYELLRVGYL